VCYECVAKDRPPRRSTYSFIASTGKSIEAHLRKAHQLVKSPANSQITDSRSQTTIHETLGLSPNNKQHNYVINQLQRLFNSDDNELLLMNWIIMDNLPFRVVMSERFRHYLESVNPAALIPTRQLMINPVTKEYQHAIPQIK
jgi:hypothetical protein